MHGRLSPYKPWSKCSIENLGGSILANLGGYWSSKFLTYHIKCHSKCNQTIMTLNMIPVNTWTNLHEISQSINLFVQKCNKHWTGHQGRMQPPLTGARKNDVSKSNKWQYLREKETRNSSGDEIANVNFLYDDIVHVLQNTIDSCINSATDRRGGYVLEPMFAKFSEITQCNGHYAVQGHTRSPILVPVESSYTTSY